MTRAFFMFAFAIGMNAGAHAQSSAQDNAALLNVCSGVLEQGAGGVSGNHAQLCACLVRETSTKLSLEEMTAYSDAALNNKAPPQAVMNKVTAIATRCLHEAQ